MERPLEPYFALFREKGVAYRLENGFLRVQGTLSPGEYRLSGKVSSQFITGLLLALPLLPGDGESEIVITDSLESKGYVDIDPLGPPAVRRPSGECKRRLHPFPGPGGPAVPRRAVSVEGDYSQAAFFLAYNRAAREEAVYLHGLSPDSVQGDKAAAEILSLYQNDGDLTVDASGIPDLIPALAVAAGLPPGRQGHCRERRPAAAKGERPGLATTHQLLRSLGAEAETGEDSSRSPAPAASPAAGSPTAATTTGSQ